MFRITTTAGASLRRTNAVESVRAGANDDLLTSINQFTAREKDYLNQLFDRVNVGAAMLERDFTITGNVLEQDVDGNPRLLRLGTFQIVHAEHGRLMSLDAGAN